MSRPPCSEWARTLGFYLLADLALGLVRAQTGQSLDDLVQELTLLVAAAPPPRQAERG
jgi:hypothetical protein